MIGTSIRSIRHLFRVSDTSLKTILVNYRGGHWDICKVFKSPAESEFGETVFILNNTIRQSRWGADTVLSSKMFKSIVGKSDILKEYKNIFSISLSEIPSLSEVFSEIVLLPNNFEEQYDKFLKENAKLVTTLQSSLGIHTNDIRVKRIYIYSDDSKNFFQWAVNAYFRNNVSLSTIKHILLWNESYKQLSKNLSKGTITAYTSRDSIIPLLNELSELRKEKRINDSINSFNTLQKKMLKENELSSDVKQALWKLSRLSDTKKTNFIKKVSSIDDFNELTRQLKFATSVHFSWTKESFMDFIDNVEEIKYEKIFENENIVLVKILDYETVKQLGKTTNWCISKNKSYWNNYIENYHGQTTQYMVFDFSKLEDDKLSIIGFTTTKNRGITSAHNFINDNLMGNREQEKVLLNSFIERFNETGNIYDILSNDGIDITLVVDYDKPPYEWSQKVVMDYLYECVKKENVDILVSKGNKIVLSVTDSNICYFFGDCYQDNISSDYNSLQHIIFMDFNKNKFDRSKLQFAIIEEDGYGDEDYCIGVFNEHSLEDGANFDSLLIEFGLPYDTIRRTNNTVVRLKNALFSYNTPMIKECMKKCDGSTLKNLIDDICYEAYQDLIYRSIDDFLSFDYLNLIYDNGLTLADIMPIASIGELIKHLSQTLKSLSRATSNFTNMEGVTDTDIDDFYNLKTERYEDTKYIGNYLAIKMILENETKLNGEQYNEICRKLSSYMTVAERQIDVFEQIISLVKDKFDYNHKGEFLNYLVRYAVFYGSAGLKTFIMEKANNSSAIKEYYNRYNAEFIKMAEKIKKHESNQKNGNGLYSINLSANIPEYVYLDSPF